MLANDSGPVRIAEMKREAHAPAWPPLRTILETHLPTLIIAAIVGGAAWIVAIDRATTKSDVVIAQLRTELSDLNRKLETAASTDALRSIETRIVDKIDRIPAIERDVVNLRDEFRLHVQVNRHASVTKTREPVEQIASLPLPQPTNTFANLIPVVPAPQPTPAPRNDFIVARYVDPPLTIDTGRHQPDRDTSTLASPSFLDRFAPRIRFGSPPSGPYRPTFADPRHPHSP